MIDPLILPLTFTGKWRGGQMQQQWDGIPITYAIRHEPTRTIYFGSSANAAVAFYSWYQRLRGLNTQPYLSPAFRAIYTKRDDFVFIVLKTWDRGVSAHAAAQTATDCINKLRGKRPDKLLNMDGSTKETEFWRALTPPENQIQPEVGVEVPGVGRYPEG